MKRNLLLLLCLISVMISRAQGWTEPNGQNYPYETPVYVRVMLNGASAKNADSQIQVAAFVEGDEDCRALAFYTPEKYSGYNYDSNKDLFTLRVLGNSDDMKKNIIFKVWHKGIVYRLKKTIQFDGETYPQVPLVLNVDVLNSISLPGRLDFEEALPFTYDLSKELTYDYGKSPKNESELDPDAGYSLSWWYQSGSNVTINSAGVMTVTGEATKVPIEAVLKDGNKNTISYASTTLFFTEATVKVSSITYTGAAPLVCEVGDNVFDMIREKLTILPANAANKDVSFGVEASTGMDVTRLYFGTNGVARRAGTYILVVFASDGSGVSTKVGVKVNTPVSLSFPATTELSKYYDTELNLTLVEGDNFDPAKVNVVPFDDSYINVSGSGLTWKLSANKVFNNATYQVYYGDRLMSITVEGKEMSEGVCRCPVEVKLPQSGWDWIAAPASTENYSLVNFTDNSYVEQINKDASNKIIDLRSQTDLLYNDPTLGLFGTIQALSGADGMYKVKAQYSDVKSSVLRMDVYVRNGGGYTKTIQKGYTWIAYPNEYDLTLAELNEFYQLSSLQTVYEGDMIIGKDGFAEYDGKKWVGSDGFTLTAGKGYIYYTEHEKVNPAFGAYIPNYIPPVYAKAMDKRILPWEYDATQYSDNMAVVATVDGLTTNTQSLSIGAFVEDECRGYGTFVEDGKALISVAGNAGENVTFRLYDEETDTYYDITETLKYNTRVGSLSAPVNLSSEDTTGIFSVNKHSAAPANDNVYNLNGQRVNAKAKGLVVKGGKKYIVK